MKKIIKTAKAELRKKGKSEEERACLQTILRLAKAMSKNSEIKIEIIPRAERIHLVPSDEVDKGWLPCEKEILDELMNMGRCCGECCCNDDTKNDDPAARETIPHMGECDKSNRVEAGESM